MNYAPDLTAAAIKMVLALGVVLLIVWGLHRLAKGRLTAHAGGGRHKLINVMESQFVGVKKSIAMVQIPGSILVLGIGTDSVSLLTQINDQDVIRGIETTSIDRRTTTFKEHLQRLTNPKGKTDPNSHTDSVVT